MRELAFRVLAIAFSLALFEGGLRLLDQPRYDTCWVTENEFWREDPMLGFAYEPGMAMAGGVVNALGLRGPVPAHEKPAGARRILYIGDSTVYGFGVADDEAFWSLATRALAARHPGQSFEPMVAAAPGYSSYQSRVLVERFAPFAPDWAVLYVGAHNDERRRMYYEDAAIPARAARQHATWHQLRALRAGEFLIDRLGRWVEKQVGGPTAWRRVPPAAFEANLRAMLATARAAGARPLLLIPPLADTLARRYPATPVYQEILKRVAAEQQIASVALEPLFAAYDPKDLYRPDDDFHPNPLGHRLIADAIVQAIEAAENAGN